MEPLPASVLKGIAEFNRRDFFECHESIEEAWGEENGRVRVFYQGLIQVAVGCCHAQRGNLRGALDLLALGHQKLEPFAPSCQGVDVKGLLEQSGRLGDTLRRLGEGGLSGLDPAEFPVIRMEGAAP